MQRTAGFFIIHTTAVWCAAAATRKAAVQVQRQEPVSMVSKVVQLLQGMVYDAVAEKKAEEVSFANFSTWCTVRTASSEKEITEQGEIITTATAVADNADVEAKRLGKEIEVKQYDVQNYTKKSNEADAQRAKDHAEFLKTDKDYTESISALGRAITVLETQAHDKPALEQLSASEELPPKARDMVAAFAYMMDEPEHTYTQPTAAVYKYQSGTIVETLTQLLDAFTAELTELRKSEMSSAHACDKEGQDLKNLVSTTSAEIASATKQMQKHEARSALAKKNSARALEVKTAEEATLKDVTTECSEKELSFKEKQELREDEVTALNKAIEILSHADVQGLDDMSFAQTRNTTALAQLGDVNFRGASSARVTGRRAKLYAFLNSEAKRLHSSRIKRIIARAATHPFGEVKIMIRDMMQNLQEEAHQDETHEGFCNKELNVNKIQRESFSEDIDGLTADIQEGTASIASMAKESMDLTADVTRQETDMHEASMARLAEKANNEATVTDCRKGEAAVAEAIALLRKFYAKALEATALVQTSAKYPYMHSEEWDSLANPNFVATPDTGDNEGMQTFGDVYAGKQEAATGILAILDVVMSDFVSLRSETEVSEVASQRGHESFIQESEKDIAAKGKMLSLLASDRKAAEAKLGEDSQDLKASQDKLDAADRYLVDLKKQCDVVPQTYEERTAARAAEIQSLKEALKMLTYEDVASANDGAAA